MWSGLSHTLEPLTEITSNKVKFKWTKIEQDAIDAIKRIKAHDIWLTYPDFNEEFKNHTNASDFQLGAVIRQKGKTITLYSRHHTVLQKKVYIIEKKIIICVETLKESKTILIGRILRIYTDNKTIHVRILILIDY